MGFVPGEKLEGKSIDYVFLGSCTNGRIEDFRVFAHYVKGKRKADHVTAWLGPRSAYHSGRPAGSGRRGSYRENNQPVKRTQITRITQISAIW